MTGADGPIEIELRFFANFRSAVGQKEIARTFDAGATVGDVLAALESEFPGLEGEVLDGEGAIKPQLSVLKNGREVVHMDGTATALEAGDQLSVFPPVAGGARTAETREFRGISKRLAANYLENLGGERSDSAGDRVEGDGWAAELTERKVNPVPGASITLNEVRVEFEGDEERLRAVVDRFAQKAMRAGG
nr:ubiquitin-like small modifier protein 1 [Natronomonas sp.]